MRPLLPAALAAFALALPAPAPAAPCAPIAAERTRLATEYQMNQAVIADYRSIRKRKRDRRRAERIGRAAVNVGVNLLLPFPLGAAVNLAAHGAESAVTGKPLIQVPKKRRGSASIAALGRRQQAITRRLARTERAGGCDFFAGG